MPKLTKRQPEPQKPAPPTKGGASANIGKVELAPITREMETSYLDYAMSVIIARALPDVRDGLKPAHRRILYAMGQMGLRHTAKHTKSAKVVGEVLGNYHPHGDSAVYDTMVRLAQPWNMRATLVDGQGNFGCFTGDTRIKLLDGTEPSFEELTKRFRNGETFSVYSCNAHGEVVVGEARNPRITRRKAELAELTFNDGSTARCTPNHRFLLRSGQYKQAKDLTRGDQLMVAAFDTKPVKEDLNPYLRVKHPRSGKWEFVHRLVDRFNFVRGRAPQFHSPFVRHHVDFDRFNNAPENIVRMTFLEHLKLHAAHVGELWKDPAFRSRQRAGVRDYFRTHPHARAQRGARFVAMNRSEEFRRVNGQRVAATLRRRYAEHPEERDAIAQRARERWTSQAYRTKMSKALRGIEKRPLTPEERHRVARIISEHSKRMWSDPMKRAEIVAAAKRALSDPEVRVRRSESAKRLWNDPAYRAKYTADHHARMAKKLWEDPSAREFHRLKISKQWEDPKFQAAHRAGVVARNRQLFKEQPNYYRDLAGKSAVTLRKRWRDPAYKERVVKSKVLGYVAGLLAQHGDVSAERYESARTNNGVPRLERALEYFSDFETLVREARQYNHRVVAIRRLRTREDVYDITVEGHHNFLLANGVFVHNSMDGDSAAAYRYTEARLTAIAEELLRDLEKETVPFIPNFDGTRQEPTVLPALLPNLLLNGTVGIAVGMATSIPPHNLGELCDAIVHLIDHPSANVEDLLQFVKGPDFPTGGTIFDQSEITRAYATGKGAIVTRAKAEIVEEGKHGMQIIVSEIPYAVNKATLLEHIAELVSAKKLEGIRDLRDESSKGDVRVVIDLKKDAYPKKVLNRLFHSTELQTTFHVNMLAIVDGIQPRVLNLKGILDEYIKHRKDVVRRRTQFDLTKAKERAHILEGLKIAILHIDEVIATIKKSEDRDDARVNLIKRFKLTEPQANAILDMRLSQLANLERLKVETELKEKTQLIKDLEALLKSEARVLGVIKEELKALRAKYATPRRTEVRVQGVKEFRAEDLIPNVSAIVMVTKDGYLKRVPPDTFKTQGRGGKGVIGLTTKEADVVEHLFATMTHADVLFFTTRGRVFQLKAYDIPEASRTAKGQALVNFLNLSPAEKVSAILPISDLAKDEKYLVMVTKYGVIKKVDLESFANVRKAGLIALKLRGDDLLTYVKPSTGHDEVLLVSRQGQAIRFREKDVRAMGRVAAGVRGMKLAKRDDVVVGMDVIGRGCSPDSCEVLVIMEHGFGKRTKLNQYRVQGRGGSGIKTAEITSKTGRLVTAFVINAKAPPTDLIVVSKNGQVIRLPYAEIRIAGRATQGVRVMRFKEEGDEVASVTYV